MILDTLIQKIEEKVKQVDGSYITKHRQTSADIVLYDTREKDENGNIIYSDVQSEINNIKDKNIENDEIIEDMGLKQKTISELFHSITKVTNTLVETSTSELPTSYGIARYIKEYFSTSGGNLNADNKIRILDFEPQSVVKDMIWIGKDSD